MFFAPATLESNRSISTRLDLTYKLQVSHRAIAIHKIEDTMGGKTTALRQRAEAARLQTIQDRIAQTAGSKKRKFEAGELHYGAWQVVYNNGAMTLPMVVHHYIPESLQTEFVQTGVRKKKYKVKENANTGRTYVQEDTSLDHVEDAFLKDIILQFRTTGSIPPAEAPIKKSARVYFWLYYSPCKNCFSKIESLVTNTIYNPNNLHGLDVTGNRKCWLKMTFAAYYAGNRPGAWANDQAAQNEYDRLKAATNGGVIIRPNKIDGVAP